MHRHNKLIFIPCLSPTTKKYSSSFHCLSLPMSHASLSFARFHYSILWASSSPLCSRLRLSRLRVENQFHSSASASSSSVIPSLHCSALPTFTIAIHLYIHTQLDVHFHSIFIPFQISYTPFPLLILLALDCIGNRQPCNFWLGLLWAVDKPFSISFSLQTHFVSISQQLFSFLRRRPPFLSPSFILTTFFSLFFIQNNNQLQL